MLASAGNSITSRHIGARQGVALKPRQGAAKWNRALHGWTSRQNRASSVERAARKKERGCMPVVGRIAATGAGTPSHGQFQPKTRPQKSLKWILGVANRCAMN